MNPSGIGVDGDTPGNESAVAWNPSSQKTNKRVDRGSDPASRCVAVAFSLGQMRLEMPFNAAHGISKRMRGGAIGDE